MRQILTGMTLLSLLVLAGFAAPLAAPDGRSPRSAMPPEGAPSGRSLPQRFTFDGGFLTDGDLEFNFARDREIIWSGQTAYGVNQPRYEQAPLALAGAPRLESVRETPNNMEVMCSGYDHDGVTPILVVYDSTDRLLDVYTVAGDELLVAEQTGIGRNRTDISGFYRPDMLLGAVPDRAHEPVCAVVCHGLIVMQCVVWENQSDVGDSWSNIAVSFFVSQNAGVTWELFHEDSVVDANWNRAQIWCMQNWWPMERGAAPTEAFFASADYRYNPGALGGRTYVMQATRSGVGSPWTLGPVKVTFERAGMRNEHFHTAAVLPLPQGGMGVITAVGDSQQRNRIVSQVRADTNYHSDEGWETRNSYHGSRYRAFEADARAFTNLPPVDNPQFESIGTEGNQFVGCAPGPNSGDLLMGADLTSDQIMAIDASDIDREHPRTRHVYGLSPAVGNLRAEVFLIRTPTPEDGGPYFARYLPRSSGDLPVQARRVLYSPDGQIWSQVFQPNDAGLRGALHGEHLYVSSFINGFGVLRLPTPELLMRRPLRIGAGGMQRMVREPWTLNGPGGTLTPLTRNAEGLWMHEGEPIDPQPPCAGQVYHATCSRFFESDQTGRVRLTGSATDVGQAVSGNALQMRMWIMNNLEGVSMHPGLELRDRANVIHMMQRPNYASIGRWFPVLGVRNADVTPGEFVELRVIGSSNEFADDADFFLAIDSVVEGVGAVDYALPPVDADAGAEWHPDELASISGFTSGDAWTITLAGQVPLDSWDGTIETTQRWPLATLWGDSQNYIELVATTASGDDNRLVASIVRDGVEVAQLQSPVTYWLRGSALLVSLADPGDGSGVQMTVSIANDEATLAEVVGGGASASPATSPTEIRFSSHHGTPGDGTEVRVTPMLWWGGEINGSAFVPHEDRRLLLETLDFLGEDTSPGDLDGDGDVDQSDLGILLASYLVDDGGDVDGDGDTDQSDLGILLANYGYGTEARR